MWKQLGLTNLCNRIWQVWVSSFNSIVILHMRRYCRLHTIRYRIATDTHIVKPAQIELVMPFVRRGKVATKMDRRALTDAPYTGPLSLHEADFFLGPERFDVV